MEKRLIVELDGGQHVQLAEQDERRSADLHDLGFTVIRFWNDQVLRETDAVLEQILSHLKAAPHPNPLPARGERE